MISHFVSSSVQYLYSLENLIVEQPHFAEPKVLTALAQAEVCDDAHAKFVATIQLAKIAWHLTEYEKGIHYCSRAEQLLLPEFETKHLAELYDLYAQQYWGLECIRSAHNFWNKAMEKALLNDQLSYQIDALIGIGNSWRVGEKTDYSYSALSLAMVLSEQYELPILAGKSAILLAMSLSNLKQYPLMLEIINKAPVYLKDHYDLAWYVQIEDLKSIAYLHLNRLDDAEESIEKASELVLKNGKKWMHSHVLLNCAVIKAALGKVDQAYDKLKAAELISLKYQQDELLAKIYYQLFELSSVVKKSEDAYIFYRKYRHFEINLLQRRSVALGKDECLLSQPLLDHATQQLIERLENGRLSSTGKVFAAYRDPSLWLYECQRLTHPEEYYVFVIQLNTREEVTHLLPLLQSLCQSSELISRTTSNQIIMLNSLAPQQIILMENSLNVLIEAFPWWRVSMEEIIVKKVLGCSVKEYLGSHTLLEDRLL